MSGGTFERELKGVLRGDEGVLERVTKTCPSEEREAYWKIVNRPFTVLRAAGSLGVDIVALRGDVSFPIEVKASKNKTLWLSNTRRTIEQAEDLLEECARSELLPLYAYRRKNVRGDSWRIFTLDGAEVSGGLKKLQRKIPKASRSKEGNHILRWEAGLPLHAFIDFMAGGVVKARPKR
ncbi:MAG: Holliday junction resolvase [Thermoplasmata archaeon]